MSSQYDMTFRRAKIEDIKAVRQMIQDLADFEKLGDWVHITEEDLIRDAGLSDSAEVCQIFILELNNAKENAKPLPIGYAICFVSYSTFDGKSYFLEDIYVRPEYRGTGAGRRIFREVAAVAKATGCKRVDFHVLGWNPARKFYAKMGAENLTVEHDWMYYRITEDQINNLSTELANEKRK